MRLTILLLILFATVSAVSAQADTIAAAFGLGIMFFMFFFIALGIAAFIFWILMLVDCAKRKFTSDNEKVVWIIIIALLGVIGAIVYYFVIKLPAKKKVKVRKRK